MKLSATSYVPSVRIRAAELQGLKDIDPNLAPRVCPLFTLPPIEFNFETNEPTTDIDTHVRSRIETIKNNWRGKNNWIDVHPRIQNVKLKNDKSIISSLVHSLTQGELFEQPEVFTPVLSLNASNDISAEVFQLAKSSNNIGFGFRVHLDDLISPSLETTIRSKIAKSGLPTNLVDLIIDLKAPANFMPLEIFANSILNRLKAVTTELDFRNIVLISTAIPENYSTQSGIITLYPRHDWNLYRKIIDNTMYQSLIYGDYTIVHPNWNADIDMRKIQAPAKLIYAVENLWLTRKGTAFLSNPSQMHTLCSDIVNSGYFKGESYSEGSRYIYDCAGYRERPSNLTRWKRVAINHHITVVLNDLSTLREVS